MSWCCARGADRLDGCRLGVGGERQLRRPGKVCHADVIAVWLGYFSDATLRWLGGHELAVGWAEELDDRVRDLLEGEATGPLG